MQAKRAKMSRQMCIVQDDEKLKEKHCLFIHMIDSMKGKPLHFEQAISNSVQVPVSLIFVCLAAAACQIEVYLWMFSVWNMVSWAPHNEEWIETHSGNFLEFIWICSAQFWPGSSPECSNVCNFDMFSHFVICPMILLHDAKLNHVRNITTNYPGFVVTYPHFSGASRGSNWALEDGRQNDDKAVQIR